MKKLLLITIIFIGCKKEFHNSTELSPEKIVLIAQNTPTKFIHLIKADSIGKKVKDSVGPKMYYIDNGFSFLNSQNTITNWLPKNKKTDTLEIPYYQEYLEISFNNYFTSMKESFLVKNGDTVIFDFKHGIPFARVKNRTVNDIELNYNRYRLKKLFGNKYTSHHLVFNNIFIDMDFDDGINTTIHYYIKAIEDGKREKALLDSLRKSNLISDINYQYRISALNSVLESHKHLKLVKRWLENNKPTVYDENIKTIEKYNFSMSDSLMKFYFFRSHLKRISKYNLKPISINRGNSGSSFIDSRVRFDSILKDKRFNQTVRNYLLFEAYKEIGMNFKVDDKEEYFKKLQNVVTDKEQLKRLASKHKLDFNQSDKLIMTSLNNESISYKEMLEIHKGKWLYIDIWASWCVPCRESNSNSKNFRKFFEKKNITFIFLSLNDEKHSWEKAIQKDNIQDAKHYFIENGNTSKVIEELKVATIPHYLIYNPKGKLVNGYAKRPNKGAKEQLLDLLEN